MNPKDLNKHVNTKIILNEDESFEIQDLHEQLNDYFVKEETKLTLNMYDIRFLWSDQSDSTRLEIIKSIIYTAPDMHKFAGKVNKLVNSNKFKESLD